METTIWQTYPQDQVILIGIINTLNQSQISNFIEENSLTFPILFDPGSSGGVQGGETYNEYYLPNDGSPYPRDFIVDQQGILQYANNEIDTEWMHYILSLLVGDSCDDWLPGDTNNDEALNILDIVTLIMFILGTDQTVECQSEASDLNQDGGLNILDIVQLANIILNS